MAFTPKKARPGQGKGAGEGPRPGSGSGQGNWLGQLGRQIPERNSPGDGSQ